MLPQTRRLYKEIIFIGRDYPAGLSLVRRKAKEQFFAMKNEIDEEKIKKVDYFYWNRFYSS